MDEKTGSVTIAPDVLHSLVRMTALATPGVARLAPTLPNSVRRFFGQHASEGMEIQIIDHAVTIDLYVIAEPSAQMLQLGQTLQREINRAIHDVVGMPVAEINVHIEDVADPLASPALEA